MEAGMNYDLQVIRKSDIGYMLQAEDTEILLHNKEVTRELQDGEIVHVFLYYDSKKRLAATMYESNITLEKADWVEVKNVVHGLGVFVGCGIAKDMLIAADYLPYNDICWPQVGDYLFCILKNKGRLNAKIVNYNESRPFAKEEGIALHDNIKARVTRINIEGIGLYTENLSYIMVHKTQMRRVYRIGEEVEVNIMAINERGIQGTLIKQKEGMIDSDADRIMQYLKENNRRMKFDSDSSPEDILSTFNMSKKAFKRALGHLYKEQKIVFENMETILIKED